MPAAPLLSHEEIQRLLERLPAWRREGEAIARTFRFADFTEAVSFVDRLVEPSNAQNHHPDVSIHWNEVTLSLWTHASGGLTERDFRLAETIEGLVSADA